MFRAFALLHNRELLDKGPQFVNTTLACFSDRRPHFVTELSVALLMRYNREFRDMILCRSFVAHVLKVLRCDIKLKHYMRAVSDTPSTKLYHYVV